MNNNFYGKSYITVDQITKDDVLFIFQKAEEMKQLVKDQGRNDVLKNKIMAILTYEPSSRTYSSFVAAMQRLGGGIIPMHGMTYSSVAKGESLEDTIRVFSCYADIIVIRHPEINSSDIASKYATVPVVNAGNGTGEHPTQALLDAYTIRNHFDSFEKLTVGMIGDMKNGRTVHSLSKLLLKMGVKKFCWISPKILQMPEEIRQKVKHQGAEIIETEQLDDVIGNLDVMYVTRVQKERFTDLEEYERLKLKYIITPEVLKKAKPKMIVMHPLPRIGEISYDVDNDRRAIYLREQMKNGLYVRMAILNLILRNK